MSRARSLTLSHTGPMASPAVFSASPAWSFRYSLRRRPWSGSSRYIAAAPRRAPPSRNIVSSVLRCLIRSPCRSLRLVALAQGRLVSVFPCLPVSLSHSPTFSRRRERPFRPDWARGLTVNVAAAEAGEDVGGVGRARAGLHRDDRLAFMEFALVAL